MEAPEEGVETKKKPNRKDRNKDQRTNNDSKKRKKNEKPKRKNDQSLPEAVYNKLWCIDLAIEQALEKCVEAKIQN